MTQKFVDEHEDIPGEVTEIGCMCIKCTCKKTVPTVVSICDSCLKDKHSQSSMYN
jgi:hypothetical protein